MGGAYVFRTLDAHQTRTVTAIVDQIIPETDTPGAVGVHVHEWIDLLLTEFFTPEDRARFLQGLAELDARSRREHGGVFVDLEKDRQLALLEALQEEANECERAKPGPRETSWGRPCRCAESTTRPITAWIPLTRVSIWTSRAPATHSTSSTRPRCI